MPGPLSGLKKATSIGPDPNPPGHPEDDWLGTAIQGLLGTVGAGDDTSQANRGGQVLGAMAPFSRLRRAGPDAVEALMKTLVGVNPVGEEEAAGLAAKKFFGEPRGKQQIPGGRLDSRLEAFDERTPRPDTVLSRPSLRELQVMDWKDNTPAGGGPGSWRGKGGRRVVTLINPVKAHQTSRPGAFKQPAAPGYESKFSSALSGEDRKIGVNLRKEDQSRAGRKGKAAQQANKP